MTSDLNRSLGSRQFLNVANERTVLHRARAHLKVPGCSLGKHFGLKSYLSFCRV